jgi:hypothetical protein
MVQHTAGSVLKLLCPDFLAMHISLFFSLMLSEVIFKRTKAGKIANYLTGIRMVSCRNGQ